MKLNYYMRGLGIGIVVTAILMGIASSGKKEQMTDEEIRQRAMEMGMVDGNVVLADMPENHEDEEDEKDGQKEEGNEKEEVLTSLSGNGSADDKESAKDTLTEQQDQENDENVNEIIVISINSGDGSRVVANKLLQAGMIEDAAAFDEYLCRNGYDKRLKTGRHDIPANATDEEIAGAITQKGY